MSQLTIAEVKRHCQAEGFDDDDALLAELQAAAEVFVSGFLRRDLDAELPGAWPVDCLLAVKMLVAHWYAAREAADTAARQSLPFGVRELLAPHRDLS